MYNVSDRFLATLTGSHTAYHRVEVLENNRVVDELPVEGGGVNVEAGAVIRRSCSITVPDALRTWFPNGTTADRLHPYGVELRPWSGVRYSDFTTEEVPLGTFGITNIEADDDNGTLAVSGLDRSNRAQRSLQRPVAIPGTTPLDLAAARLLRSVDPGAEFSFAQDMELSVAPKLYKPGEEALAKARELARSGGFLLYTDVFGRYTMPPAPGALGGARPVAVLQGGIGGVKIGSKRTFSSEDKPYNGVIILGAAVRGQQIRFEIWDDNEQSLTRRNGPYQPNPEVITDDKVGSYGAAERQGRSRLQFHLGKGEEVPLTMLPNPALDVNDMVLLRHRDGTIRAYFIQSLSVPLTVAESMSVVLRRGVFGDDEDATSSIT